MPDEDLFKRRLRTAMRDAADVTDDVAAEHDLPPAGPAVYQAGLKLFDARVALIFRDPAAFDLPDDAGWGVE